MKTVNAVWEKRNLGCETIEVTFEYNDSLDEAKKTAKELTAEYIVLKVPSNRTDIMLAVQKYGYIFVEDAMYLVSYLDEVKRNSIEQRFYDAVSVEDMDAADMERLKKEVLNGLFDSDRIYIDPYFTHKQAAKRYVNWIDDEILRGTKFYKYIYKGSTIGFFALKETEAGHYTSFLGGIYKECRKGGIGTAVKVPEAVKKLGGSSVGTHVSTNNMAQIKNLIKNGYVPEGLTHIFIKHNKGDMKNEKS